MRLTISLDTPTTFGIILKLIEALTEIVNILRCNAIYRTTSNWGPHSRGAIEIRSPWASIRGFHGICHYCAVLKFDDFTNFRNYSILALFWWSHLKVFPPNGLMFIRRNVNEFIGEEWIWVVCERECFLDRVFLIFDFLALRKIV